MAASDRSSTNDASWTQHESPGAALRIAGLHAKPLAAPKVTTHHDCLLSVIEADRRPYMICRTLLTSTAEHMHICIPITPAFTHTFPCKMFQHIL